MDGKTTQMPMSTVLNVGSSRVSRRIGFDGKSVRYETLKSKLADQLFEILRENTIQMHFFVNISNNALLSKSRFIQASPQTYLESFWESSCR
jgi:hypothetical protein